MNRILDLHYGANRSQKKVDVDAIRNVIITYDLHPKNVQRLKRKYGGPTTLILFKLKNKREMKHVKRYGINLKITLRLSQYT